MVDSEVNDITKRLENALNEGLFEQAEQIKIEKIEEAATSSNSVIDGADKALLFMKCLLMCFKTCQLLG